VILEAVATVLEGVGTALIGVINSALPTVSFHSVGPIVQGYAFFDSFLPLGVFFEALLLSFQIAGVLLGVYIVLWALRKIPVFGPK
jgi:hypothetical protein